MGPRKGPRKRRITRGRFAGRTIEFASQNGVDRYPDIAREFMAAILHLKPGEYLISDESSLSDFTLSPADPKGAEGKRRRRERTQRVHHRIRTHFGVDVTDIASGRLVEIFKRIHDHRSAGLS